MASIRKHWLTSTAPIQCACLRFSPRRPTRRSNGRARASRARTAFCAGFGRSASNSHKQVCWQAAASKRNLNPRCGVKMLNALDAALPDSADEANHAVMREGWSILLRVLYPVVPHISTALWQRLGFSAESGGALLDAPWPEIDSSALAAAEIDLVLQINGKTRGM